VDGLLFFFLMLFLVIWAAGVWIEPVGPIAWGVPWLTFLIIGVVLALILAAAVPPRARPVEPPRETAEASAAALALGLFFYLAMVALVIVIVAHYAWALSIKTT
jgi:type VI protein secretion system component VasK